MANLATTKLSSKGQIVIPEPVRLEMGLQTGDQFIIMAEKDVVILKPITPPDMKMLKPLIKKAREVAKAVGLSHSDVKRAIKDARKK